MRRTWLAWLLGVTLTACGDLPVVPVPVPPDPTPIPTPPEPQPDEVARAKWDAVAVGMTEAEITALVGRSIHRTAVGPGFLSMGYYVRIDGATHYVEAVFGRDAKVASKVVW